MRTEYLFWYRAISDLTENLQDYFSTVDAENTEALVQACRALAKGRPSLKRRVDYPKLDAPEINDRRAAAFKILGLDAARAIRSAADAHAERAYMLRDAVKQEIERHLDMLALAVEPQAGDPIQVDSIRTQSYSTQGFGASLYARSRADMVAAEYHAHGIAAEVRHNPGSMKPSTSMYSAGYPPLEQWEVWASVKTEADADVVRRRPMKLRDFLKSCWKRGVNPRVYQPFLPVGLEEKLGLDYFGNEKRAAT